MGLINLLRNLIALVRCCYTSLKLHHQGKYEDAATYAHKALDLAQQIWGNEHPVLAIILNILAQSFQGQGRFTEAENLFIEALQMSKRLLGEKHIVVAIVLNNLAELFQRQGHFIKAEPLYIEAIEALQMSKRLLGEEHIQVAASFNNLAELYNSQGRFTEAEPLFMKALQMSKNLLGEEHPNVAASLNYLARLYQNQGHLIEAEPLYIKALQMRKRLLGEEHPNVAISLNDLAGLYQSQRRFKEAKSLYIEALQMNKRLLGEEHPNVAISLNNLAGLYKSQGCFKEAEKLHIEALQMNKRLLSEEHLDVASSLHDLVLLYYSQGRFKEAEPLCIEALQMCKRLLGEEHPNVATSLNDLAVLLVLTGHPAEALARMNEAIQVEDNILRRIFAFSSEKDRLTYLQSIRHRFEKFLSLVLSYFQDSSEVVQTALDMVLKRKALSASALAAQNQALYSGRYPHLTKEFKQLRRLSEEIVHLTFAIPKVNELNSIRKTLKQKQTEYDNLQRQLAQQVPEIKLQDQPTDRRAVALELSEGSMLVEFVCTHIFDFTAPRGKEWKEWKPARYLAFILPAQQPDAVQLIDLGEAEHIDRLIQVFRQEASNENSNNSEHPLDMCSLTPDPESEYPILAYNLPPEAIQLREALFDKISPYLKNTKHLILAPDGALNILPFQLLPLAGERKLMDEYNINYLSVGRDILRAKIETTRPASPPVVIADPDFDLKPSRWVKRSETQQPVSNVNVGFRSSTQPTTLAGTSFDRAPGTRFLGESVAKMLAIKPYLDREALESHLTTDNCPSILLIATHGYFSKQKEWPEITAELATQPRDNRLFTKVENPMLRSGLALAGANTWLSGGELPKEAGKGFLFAQEVAGLDLWANELTVLSACQTGMGDIQLGEGVFGLRRAFAVAGTKSLIMSLWSVPDRVTALLMERMFADLKNGKGRGSALQSAQNYIRRITVGELRQSQLGIEVLKAEMNGIEELEPDAELPWDDNVRLLEHPYYWGAWICQGETKPMVTGE